MRAILSLLCLLQVFAIQTLSAQKIEANFWEDHWETWPRPRFDYRYPDFGATVNTRHWEFFNTHSKISGELYRHFIRLQYPTEESVQSWSKLSFTLPLHYQFTDLDYRIWKDGLLIEDARASELLIDTLEYDGVSQRLRRFALRVKGLQAPCVLEVMISCNGVPLPYSLDFKEGFPSFKSEHQFQILSSYPLKFDLPQHVSKEYIELWDDDLYCIRLDSAYLENRDPFARKVPPFWLDWQDQIMVYDREEMHSWRELRDYLFYEGDLADYIVYQNSLDDAFGLQQYLGSWRRHPRYYSARKSTLENNEYFAQGRYRLTKAYADRWLKVQETLDVLLADSLRSFDEAAKTLAQAQEQAARDYLKDSYDYPKVFTEYGLLCSHWERLFKHYKLDYRLVLFAPSHYPMADTSFYSPWPYVARGLAFRKSEQANWQYYLPGFYWGQFWDLGALPPDLQGGRALLLQRENPPVEIRDLPRGDYKQHGFTSRYRLQLSRSAKAKILHDISLHGSFRSILLHAYLKGDSAVDQLSYTTHQLYNNAVLNDSLLQFKSQVINFTDTVLFTLHRQEALLVQASAIAQDSFYFPSPGQLNWELRWDVADSLDYALLRSPSTIGPFRWDIESGQSEGHAYLRWQVYIPPGKISAKDYRLLQAEINEPLEIRLWKKKTPNTAPGM